jgi:hypothetical protein
MSFLDRLAAHRQTLDGEFIPALEAQRFVRMMQRDHPDELQEWLVTHAVQFAGQALGDILRRERQRIVRRATAATFAAAVAAGNAEDMHPFTTLVYEVGPNNLRRQVGEMTGLDHVYVAVRYEDQGLRLLLLAEFHRAVARRVGTNRTADVISEEEYLMMMNSIIGNDHAAFLAVAE